MWCGVVKGSQTNSWKVSHYLFDYLRKLVSFIITHAFYFTLIFLLFIMLLKKKNKTKKHQEIKFEKQFYTPVP